MTERVEITGSHIKRAPTETAENIQVITNEDIERSGQPTVADMLRTISANVGNSFNETFTNSFAPGASGIALRGLSQKNTLVLLNGHRVANYGFAQNIQDSFVDLNAIPAVAIERIEVLKDGASAVYGSDAIAGVVNVILRRDYQGAAVAANYATPTETAHANDYNLNAIWGMGDLAADKYNVMLSVNWYGRTELLASERSYSASADYRRFPGGTLAWGGAEYYRTIPRRPFASCGVGNPGVLGPAGDLRSSAGGTVCEYNTAPFISLIPKTDRGQLVGSGTLEISPGVTAFADVLYAHSKSDSTFTPGALTNTSVRFDPTTGGVARVSNILPVGNPSNPFTTPVGITYTFFAVGPRDTDVKTDFYRALVGMKGKLVDWDWEVAAATSESDSTDVSHNFVNAFTLANDVTNGSLNFLNPSATPAALNALRVNLRRTGDSRLNLVTANLSCSDIAQLPAGPLRFAMGGEFRHESIADRPHPLLASGAVLGRGENETQGSRSVYAGYAEFAVPVFSKLDAQVAGRYEHYSDFGSTGAPKAGLRWQPAPALLGRASISKGYRAPSLPEIAPSSATFFTAVFDPFAPPGTPSTFNTAGIFKSNPNLKPERSTNMNLGIVLSPDADTAIGFDWYRIITHDIVAGSGFQFVLQNPALFPGEIIRNPDGTLVAVYDEFHNLQGLDTSGFDLTLRRSWASRTRQMDHRCDCELSGEIRALSRSGDAAVQFRGDQCSQQHRLSRQRTGSLARQCWPHVGPCAVDDAPRVSIYIGGYHQQVVPGQTEVNDYYQFDLYEEYRGLKNIRITGSILNLFNKTPPFDALFPVEFSIPFDFTLYDARGRVVRIGIEYRFK